MNKIKAAKYRYKEGGLKELIRSIREFLYDKTIRISPFHSSPVYQLGRKSGTIQRWKLIEEYLSKEDKTLLDIGCNAGIFTSLAANKGILSIGIDGYSDQRKHLQKYPAKKYAAKLFLKGKNMGLIQLTVTPDNIDFLPKTDIVLLLAVYHHWYKYYGEYQAKKMLQALKGADKIFFEPPSTRAEYRSNKGKGNTKPKFEDNNEESIIKYNTKLLKSLFGDEYDVKMIGKSMVVAHYRYLFLIQKHK